MKICFVTNYNFNSVWQEQLDKISGNDIVVFGFNGIGLVNYKKELSGESEYFQDLTKLSKQINSVVISGCDTDTYGVFRHSAVITDCGRLLGVTDMTHSLIDSEFSTSGSYRVYQTKVGKLGIIIGDDLYFLEVAKILSLCDADLIICIMNKIENTMPLTMLKASAFSYGVNMALISANGVDIVDNKGNVTFSSQQVIVSAKIIIDREYREIKAKRRGYIGV